MLVGALVCVSRCALALTCLRGVPAARADGLGETYTESVPRLAAAPALLLALVVGGLVTGVGRAVLVARVIAVVLALAVTLLLVRHAVRRLGGVTGDVFGAAVELSLATLLVAWRGHNVSRALGLVLGFAADRVFADPAPVAPGSRLRPARRTAAEARLVVALAQPRRGDTPLASSARSRSPGHSWSASTRRTARWHTLLVTAAGDLGRARRLLARPRGPWCRGSPRAPTG